MLSISHSNLSIGVAEGDYSGSNQDRVQTGSGEWHFGVSRHTIHSTTFPYAK